MQDLQLHQGRLCGVRAVLRDGSEWPVPREELSPQYAGHPQIHLQLLQKKGHQILLPRPGRLVAIQLPQEPLRRNCPDYLLNHQIHRGETMAAGGAGRAEGDCGDFHLANFQVQRLLQPDLPSEGEEK